MALHPPAAVLLRAAVGERQRSVADTTDVERRRLPREWGAARERLSRWGPRQSKPELPSRVGLGRGRN